MKVKLVIVGGGQAAVSLVSKLKNNNYEGDISIICGEPYLPYQRPPLSKSYLLNKIEMSRLFLKPQSFYDEKDINIRLGTKATSIDRKNKCLYIGKEQLKYENLVLATGSVPNYLPKHITNGIKNIFSIRNIDDVLELKDKFSKSQSVLVVGGGYIGLEAAAVCIKKGLKVKLVEGGCRILQRVACSETSTYLERIHQSHGVEICKNLTVSSMRTKGEKVVATFSDKTSFECDFVISGIGISPDTALANKAGIKLENGIWTNSLGRTSDENIWAIGDCASFPVENKSIRLESVGHAIDHAETIAVNLTGGNISYIPKPWFWSDQYDIKLQIAGLNTGYNHIVERKTAEDIISFWYFKSNDLLAVDAINAPRDYMIGKRLIESGISPDKKILSDPKNNLKTLLL